MLRVVPTLVCIPRDVGALRSLAKKIEKAMVGESRAVVEEPKGEEDASTDTVVAIKAFLLNAIVADAPCYGIVSKACEVGLQEAMQSGLPWCSSFGPKKLDQD